VVFTKPTRRSLIFVGKYEGENVYFGFFYKWLLITYNKSLTAAGIEAVAPASGSPNGVSGKKRPKEAILTLYGIGLAVKGYKRIARSSAQIIFSC